MRNAYEPPPWLAALNTPQVKSTSGLGTGGGAGVQTPDSGGFGDILVYFGPGFSASGNVVIHFPNTPPTLFLSAGQTFGTITQATVGNDVTISWTAAAPATTGFKAHLIHYEWNVST